MLLRQGQAVKVEVIVRHKAGLAPLGCGLLWATAVGWNNCWTGIGREGRAGLLSSGGGGVLDVARS